jgi:soluble lytic murein transglycosylase
LAAQSSADFDRAPGPSLVFAARAYDRANVLDSARADYEAATVALPIVADWLWLRAAGVTADGAIRARDYAGVLTPAARARIPWTEAQARERTRDFAGAARAYDSLGAHEDALRARAALVAGAADTAPALRDSLCTEVIAFITARHGSAEARAASEIADANCAPLSPAAELTLARSAAISGPAARAVSGFARVDGLASADRFQYALALARVHRDADALREFGRVHTPEAQYQEARVLLADGKKPEARRALKKLVAATPRDSMAASALMLLADLAGDDGDDATARATYLRVVGEFPKTPHATHARFRAALLAFIAGRDRDAATEWDGFAASSEEAVAARYWSGRAWAAVGDTATAHARWRAVLTTEPLSYYAGLSGRRLDGTVPVPVTHGDTTAPAVDATIDSALGRAALLGQLGMDVEARFEVDRVAHAAMPTFSTMLAIGTALERAGETSRASAFGWRLLDSGRTDVRVYHLIFPLRYRDSLVAAARATSLDPALVAALIRQESNYMPKAQSSVGARGLMQVMPGIGRDLARAHAVGPWDPALLDDPDVSLKLGTAHFATFLAQEGGDVPRGLAAYNAGPSRVTLWSAKHGTEDPEIFVERIPFSETRDYVRNILRNRDIYAVLYKLSDTPPPASGTAPHTGRPSQ